MIREANHSAHIKERGLRGPRSSVYRGESLGLSEATSCVQFSDISKLDNRQRGQLAELAFMRKAASLGFAVSKPWQEGERYDVIVRVDSSFWRVQVKSVLRRHRELPSYRVGTAAGRQSRRMFYCTSEIDFIAAYVFSEDAWYIFPASAIVNHLSICVRPGSPKCRYRQYYEAWDLLKPNSASPLMSSPEGAT